MSDIQYFMKAILWTSLLIALMFTVLKVEPIPSFLDKNLGTDAKTGVVALINIGVIAYLFWPEKWRHNKKPSKPQAH